MIDIFQLIIHEEREEMKMTLADVDLAWSLRDPAGVDNPATTRRVKYNKTESFDFDGKSRNYTIWAPAKLKKGQSFWIWILSCVYHSVGLFEKVISSLYVNSSVIMEEPASLWRVTFISMLCGCCSEKVKMSYPVCQVVMALNKIKKG